MRTSLLALPLALLAAPSAAAILDPTRVAVTAPAPANDYSAALDAARKLKEAAAESRVRARSMPVEFAPVLRAAGYAGELPEALRSDLAAAAAFKRTYWTQHRHALGKRLGEIAAEEGRQRWDHIDNLGDSSFDRRLALQEGARMFQQNLLLHAEKNAVSGALGRVEAVLADIEADASGRDSGQALIDRKIVLFERLAR